MISKLIETEFIEDNIFIIWFNNSPVNAISIEFLCQLNIILDKVENDKSIRCLLIGSKIKHFCAGADLKERETFTQDQTIEFLNNINSIFNRIENLIIPVISLLKGATLGGGAELSLCSDFRIADQTLKIGFPETSLGIIPGAGGTYRLPRIIGIQSAKKLIYTAKPISSKLALKAELIDIESNNLLEDAVQFSKSFIINSPIGIASAKNSINNNFNEELKIGLQIERNAYKNTIGTNDRLEALKAFKEKRNPTWRNN